jgi:hypothetical protein
VGILFLCLLAVTFAWFRFVIHPPRLTKRGEQMRKQLSRSAGIGNPDATAMESQLSAFAMLGWVSLSTSLALSLELAGLQTAQPVIASSGGGGDGGGCGGGCGGCGGCGG